MMERNLTTGSVFKNVIIFSLPYLLSYFLQTLYGMADLFIIGQFEGVASTTAVSIGSQVMHMITVMLVGLAMGTTVSIGQAIGSKDKKRVAEGIGNTVILFMGVALVLMIVLLLLTKPIVTVMSTPQEAVMGTISYLTICFIGIPLLQHIILSVQFSVVWVTARVRCTLLPLHVQQILSWIMYLSAVCILDRQVQLLELPALRSSV